MPGFCLRNFVVVGSKLYTNYIKLLWLQEDHLGPYSDYNGFIYGFCYEVFQELKNWAKVKADIKD